MEYRNCVGTIPKEINNNEFISIERNSPIKMYGIGFQPAKCIPEIPEWFFKKYIPPNNNNIVLDPFAGSGTTILEAIKNHNIVYWIDNNPLSRLICTCKSVSVDSEELQKQLSSIINRVMKQEEVTVTMKFANIDLWFQKSVQEALTILKGEISKIEDEDIKNAMKLALSMTVRKMSEMEDSMILAARRTNNREIVKYSRNDVYENFLFQAKKIISAYEEWNRINSSGKKAFEMSTNDARKIKKENFFHAIVTSPPYINAIDYIWASKFELHWLDLVSDDKERLTVSSTEIGTERIPAKEYKKLAVTKNELLNQILEDIYYGKAYKATKGQNELRSRVVFQYFNDMKLHFESAYKALKKEGKYCFIIGDTSKICGIEIPVANLLRDMAEDVGFHEIFRFHVLLKNRKLNIPRTSFAGTIKHDTVIILEK